MMTTVDIARTIQSETTKTVETATADRYVKSADVDVVTVQVKRQQRYGRHCVYECDRQVDGYIQQHMDAKKSKQKMCVGHKTNRQTFGHV